MIKINKIISTTFLTSAILITIGRSPPPKAQETIIPPVSPNSTYLAQRQTKLYQFSKVTRDFVWGKSQKSKVLKDTASHIRSQNKQ